jgi:hypothetical protein
MTLSGHSEGGVIPQTSTETNDLNTGWPLPILKGVSRGLGTLKFARWVAQQMI